MNTSLIDFDFDTVDFVTSDHHFGHARISELASRPFDSVGEMNTVMIDRWNALVGPNDIVLHLGDLALGPIEQSIALTSRLNGRRLLVPGNHDRVSPATQSNRAIEHFRPLYEHAGWTVLPEILRGTRRGARLIASHYPYEGDTTGAERHSTHRPADDGIPLLHGHTHSREFGPHGAHEFHVGVDAFGFAPVGFDLVDAWLEELRSRQQEIDAILRERSVSDSSTPLDAVKCARRPSLRDGAGSRDEATTAMDVVRSAERGEISREELVGTLQSWDYEPTYRTSGLADDWESRPNGFGAVVYAFTIDLIDEETYRRLAGGTRKEATEADWSGPRPQISD